MEALLLKLESRWMSTLASFGDGGAAALPNLSMQEWSSLQVSTALRHLARRALLRERTQDGAEIVQRNFVALESNELVLLKRHMVELLRTTGEEPTPRTSTWRAHFLSWLKCHISCPPLKVEALSRAAGLAMSDIHSAPPQCSDSCPICGCGVEWSGSHPVASASQGKCAVGLGDGGSSSGGQPSCGLSFPRCAATLLPCTEGRPWHCPCCERCYSAEYFSLTGKQPSCLFCNTLLQSTLPGGASQMAGF